MKSVDNSTISAKRIFQFFLNSIRGRAIKSLKGSLQITFSSKGYRGIANFNVKDLLVPLALPSL
jgi:hypothetical protein